MSNCTGLVMRSRRAVAFGCVLSTLLLGLVSTAHADHRIGAGGVVSLGDGTVVLGCTDLVIAGTLNFDAGTYRAVRNVTVLAGGVLNGGHGTLRLAGSFTVEPGGLHDPQQLSVVPATECGAVAPAPAASPAVIPTLGDAMLAALGLLLFWFGRARLPDLHATRRLERTKP